MLDIIAYIIFALLFIFYIVIAFYFGNQELKLLRYKPTYNLDILNFADEIKKHTGISRYELTCIIKRRKWFSTPQLFAISHIMNCDLNHLFIFYSYRDKSDFFVKFL